MVSPPYRGSGEGALDIAQGDDAGELAMLNHGQAADLVFVHKDVGVVKGQAGAGGDGSLGHQVSHQESAVFHSSSSSCSIALRSQAAVGGRVIQDGAPGQGGVRRHWEKMVVTDRTAYAPRPPILSRRFGAVGVGKKESVTTWGHAREEIEAKGWRNQNRGWRRGGWRRHSRRVGVGTCRGCGVGHLGRRG